MEELVEIWDSDEEWENDVACLDMDRINTTSTTPITIPTTSSVVIPDIRDGISDLWEHDNALEETLSAMDMNVFNTNKDTTETNTGMDMEMDTVMNVDMNRNQNLKRKRVKGHENSKVREINIDQQALRELKIPKIPKIPKIRKIEPRVSQTKFHKFQENDVTVDEPISYETGHNMTQKHTEDMYNDTLSKISKLCINNETDETHKSFSRPVRIPIIDETHKLDREIGETVSKLVSLSLSESVPRNIYDKYQIMTVLKTFQNLKI